MSRRRHSRTTARRTTRRRGYLLGEMISVVPLIIVLFLLITVAIGAVLQSYRHVPQRANEYTLIEGLLATLHRDTRMARSAEWSSPADSTSLGASHLVLHTPTGELRYVFGTDRVVREALDQHHGPVQQWDLHNWTARVTSDSQAVRLLTVEVTWQVTTGRRLDPERRFTSTMAIGRGYER